MYAEKRNGKVHEGVVGGVETPISAAGQTVEPGQVIGYVGTTGSSSEPHLHFGVARLTNTNGKRAGSPASGHVFGYKVPFEVLTTEENDYGVNSASIPGMVDPFGWRAPTSIDPAGYLWNQQVTGEDGITGMGAWSPALFQASEEPPYPVQ